MPIRQKKATMERADFVGHMLGGIETGNLPIRDKRKGDFLVSSSEGTSVNLCFIFCVCCARSPTNRLHSDSYRLWTWATSQFACIARAHTHTHTQTNAVHSHTCSPQRQTSKELGSLGNKQEAVGVISHWTLKYSALRAMWQMWNSFSLFFHSSYHCLLFVQFCTKSPIENEQ